MRNMIPKFEFSDRYYLLGPAAWYSPEVLTGRPIIGIDIERARAFCEKAEGGVWWLNIIVLFCHEATHWIQDILEPLPAANTISTEEVLTYEKWPCRVSIIMSTLLTVPTESILWEYANWPVPNGAVRFQERDET